MSDVMKKAGWRLLIVMPAYNEGETIFDVIASVRAQVDAHVLVVSDASTDDTCAKAEAAGATVLSLASNLGAWSATQAGIRYAVRHGYTHVLTMDADGQHLPEECLRLIDHMSADGADVVIGAFEQRASGLRQLAWRWFRLLTGLSIHDLTSGFRLYGSHALNVLVGREATLLDHQDVGILLLLRHAQLRVCEVEVRMLPRTSGKSRVFQSWWRILSYMTHTSIFCLAKLGSRGKTNHLSVGGR